jgi:hypothetical protein
MYQHMSIWFLHWVGCGGGGGGCLRTLVRWTEALGTRPFSSCIHLLEMSNNGQPLLGLACDPVAHGLCMVHNVGSGQVGGC